MEGEPGKGWLSAEAAGSGRRVVVAGRAGTRWAHQREVGQERAVTHSADYKAHQRPDRLTRPFVGEVGKGVVSPGRTRIPGSSPARVCRASSAPRPSPRARARADQGRAPTRKSCTEKVPEDRTCTTSGGKALLSKGCCGRRCFLRAGDKTPAATATAGPLEKVVAVGCCAGYRDQTPAPVALWAAGAADLAGFRKLLCLFPPLCCRYFQVF